MRNVPIPPVGLSRYLLGVVVSVLTADTVLAVERLVVVAALAVLIVLSDRRTVCGRPASGIGPSPLVRLLGSAR